MGSPNGLPRPQYKEGQILPSVSIPMFLSFSAASLDKPLALTTGEMSN